MQTLYDFIVKLMREEVFWYALGFCATVITIFFTAKAAKEATNQSIYLSMPVLVTSIEGSNTEVLFAKVKNIGNGLATNIKLYFIQHQEKDVVSEGPHYTYLEPNKSNAFDFRFPLDIRFPGCVADEYLCQYEDMVGRKYESKIFNLSLMGSRPEIKRVRSHKKISNIDYSYLL